MSRFFATWFFVGYIPFFAGSWGALAGFPAMWLAWRVAGNGGLLIGMILVGAIGFWAIAQGSGDDAPEIVIDEVLGQWIASLPVFFILAIHPILPSNIWLWLLLSFALFRFFDILKPWPIYLIERLPHAWGIMGDDIVAGIFSALLLSGGIWFG